MKPLLAYLDPMTGGILMQVLLGALAVFGLTYQYMKRGAKAIRSAFRRDKGTEDTVETDSP